MRTGEPLQAFILPRGQTLEIEGGQDRRLECRRGVLWLTQEGEGRDIVLHAGQSFCLDRPGVALVQACRPSALALRGGRHG